MRFWNSLACIQWYFPRGSGSETFSPSCSLGGSTSLKWGVLNHNSWQALNVSNEALPVGDPQFLTSFLLWCQCLSKPGWCSRGSSWAPSTSFAVKSCPLNLQSWRRNQLTQCQLYNSRDGGLDTAYNTLNILFTEKGYKVFPGHLSVVAVTPRENVEASFLINLPSHQFPVLDY